MVTKLKRKIVIGVVMGLLVSGIGIQAEPNAKPVKLRAVVSYIKSFVASRAARVHYYKKHKIQPEIICITCKDRHCPKCDDYTMEFASVAGAIESRGFRMITEEGSDGQEMIDLLREVTKLALEGSYDKIMAFMVCNANKFYPCGCCKTATWGPAN